MKFFNEMINNFSQYFQKIANTNYPNQTAESCKIIYNKCVETNPYQVIEIGTNYGASTLSLIKALYDNGKDLSFMTTIDVSHDHWLNRTPSIQSNLIQKYSLEINKIKTITKDFISINPNNLIIPHKNTLIFYDMHDHTGPWSLHLLEKWFKIPFHGTFIMHDFSKVIDSFKWKDGIYNNPRSVAKHFNGQNFAGFAECSRVINWLNINKIDIVYASHAMIIFRNFS